MNSNNNKIAEQFDRSSKTYADLYNYKNRVGHFFQSRLKRVYELFDDINPGKVLEVGCGPGLVAKELLDRGFDYQGIDISEGMISECQRRYESYPGAKFQTGDVQNIQFPDASFDVVLCLGALEYVHDEAIAWKEIRRVSKPGGKVIISGINLWSPYNNWDRFVYRRFTYVGKQGMIREFGTEKMYRQFGQDCGLSPIDLVYFNFWLIPPPLDKFIIELARALADKMEILGRSSLRKLGNGFLVKYVAN